MSFSEKVIVYRLAAALLSLQQPLAQIRRNPFAEATEALLPDWLETLRNGTPGPGAVDKAIQNTQQWAPELTADSGVVDVTSPNEKY